MKSARILNPVPEVEAEYVNQGRAAFRVLYGSSGAFESLCWDLRVLRRSTHKQSNSALYFTCLGSTTEPLPPRFGNVIKAYVALNFSAAATMVLRVDAARMLWSAISKRLNGESEAFRWQDVTETDALAAEQEMLEHWAASTTYKRCIYLQGMLRSLASARGGGIVRLIRAPFVTPRTDDSERYTLENSERRLARLPPHDAITALVDIYAVHATEPPDRLIVVLSSSCLGRRFVWVKLSHSRWTA